MACVSAYSLQSSLVSHEQKFFLVWARARKKTNVVFVCLRVGGGGMREGVRFVYFYACLFVFNVIGHILIVIKKYNQSNYKLESLDQFCMHRLHDRYTKTTYKFHINYLCLCAIAFNFYK